jgi:hypothetical protein
MRPDLQRHYDIAFEAKEHSQVSFDDSSVNRAAILRGEPVDFVQSQDHKAGERGWRLGAGQISSIMLRGARSHCVRPGC